MNKYALVVFLLLAVTLPSRAQHLVNMVYNSEAFAVKLDQTTDKKGYKIMLVGTNDAGTADTALSAITLSAELEFPNFKVELVSLLKRLSTDSDPLSTDPALEKEIVVVYNKLKESIADDKIASIKSQFQDGLQSTLDSAEKIERGEAAVFKVKDSIPLWHTVEKQIETKSWQFWRRDTITIEELDAVPNTWFSVKRASVTISQGEVAMILIEGDIKTKNPETGKVSITYPNAKIDNGSYTASLYKINELDQGVWFKVEATWFKVYFSQIFELLPAKNGEYCYKVADETFALTPKQNSKTLYKRGLNDYFTAVIITDPLGLSSTTPNSLLQTEIFGYLPINSTNNQYIRLFPSVELSGNASKLDGKERYIPADTTMLQSGERIVFANNFNLIRNNKLNIGVTCTFLTFTLKPADLRINCRTSYKVFRTGVEYWMPSDSSMHQDNMYTSYPEFAVQFHFSYDQNFAWGMSAGRGWLFQKGEGVVRESFGGLNHEGIAVYKPEAGKKGRDIWLFELHGYLRFSQLKTGGLFFRARNYYSPSSKRIYPEIMIGYSTDISKLIK